MGYQKPPIGAKLNHGHPLSNGLVGCWLFNEGSGDKVFDYSGQSNHGAITNVVAQSAISGWNARSYGPALSFDGGGDCVAFATALDMQKEMTVVMLANFRDYTAIQPLISNIGASGNFCSYHLEFGRTDNKLTWLQTGATLDATSTGNISDGLLHHIVGRREGAPGAWTISFAIDGKISNHNTAVNPNNPATGLCSIGRAGSYVGAMFFNGFISLCLLYNRAITDAEIVYLNAFPYCMFDYKHPVYWGADYVPPPLAEWVPRMTMIM